MKKVMLKNFGHTGCLADNISPALSRILKFTLAVALFSLIATLALAGDVIIENGKLDVSNKLYVDANGKVGIGTITPGSDLEIIGQLKISSTINDKIILAGTQAGPHTIYLDNSKGIRFWDGVSSAELMRITNDGKVGIGTTAPSERLDLNGGNIRLAHASYGFPLYIGMKYSSFEDTASIKFGGSYDNYLAFFTADTGSGGERMRITKAGNVGIGKTNPAEKLDVNGNVQAIAYFYASDERLKTNIRKLDGLDTISKLNGVNFNWISDNTADMGIIAQEVERVLPDLVKTNSETGMKTIKYGSLIAPLIEAVKELQEKNINQSAKIEELQRELELLKKEMTSLKK